MIYPTKKLGEMLELCDAGTWGDESTTGMPILRSTNMQNGRLVLDDLKYIAVPKEKTKQYILREGDILITKSSGSVDHIGKSLFITKEMDGKYGFSNFTQRLRINRRIALPKWVYLKVSDPGTRNFLLGASQTTTGLRNLKISALRELEIPMPTVGEQERIVAKIEKQFAKIDEVAGLRAENEALTAELLPAALQEIFSSAESRGWEEKPLSEITEIVTGKTPPTNKREYYDGGILWAGPSDLENGKMIFTTRKTVTQKAIDQRMVRMVPGGSILVSCIGIIGKVGIASQPMTTNQQINTFVPDEKRVTSDFLYYAMTLARPEFERLASRTTLPIINKSRSAKINITLPPLAEQKAIVKKLDALSEKAGALRDLQSAQSADLKALKQSILHEAFRNEYAE